MALHKAHLSINSPYFGVLTNANGLLNGFNDMNCHVSMLIPNHLVT